MHLPCSANTTSRSRSDVASNIPTAAHDRAAMDGVPDDASSADAAGPGHEGASPRKNRWKSAGERVMTNIHFSRGFNTLRDMVDETHSVVDASSLEVSMLFACMWSCWGTSHPTVPSTCCMVAVR